MTSASLIRVAGLL